MDWEAEKDMAKDVAENPELYEGLADSSDTMDLETENFVKAVENDEYAEYELEDGVVLITDWEGDGLFDPYVALPGGTENEEEVSDLLIEEAGHFLTFDSTEIHEQNHLTFAHIYGAELKR